MSQLPTVGVAGASGRLGRHVINALISQEFKSNFGGVVALVRESANRSTIDEKNGVKLRVYSEENMVESLKGIDILINVLSSKAYHYKDAIAKALPSTSVSLYFPSEFGVDHTVHEFKQSFWDAKKDHYELVRKLSPNIKVSRVYVGLFLEDSIGPWFGFDSKTARYESVGSADTKISFTSREDSGKVMAALSSLSTGEVPEEIHIAGDTLSFYEIKKVMENAGSAPIKVQSLDLEEFKDKLMKQPSPTPGPYLRFLIGEGRINHSKNGLGNDNDLVNKGEGKWKWIRLTQLGAQTKGEPTI